MLEFYQSLDFPRLKCVEASGTPETTKRGKPADLYVLDWDGFDRERIARRKRRFPDDKEIFYKSGLSEKYDEMIKGLKFAINDDYMREIKSNAQKAYAEWGRRRPFDTCIREMCLNVAKAHVEVAFKLLADCVVDCSYDQGPENDHLWHYLENALLYRFWYNQTGTAVAYRNAHMDKLKSRVKDMRRQLFRPEDMLVPTYPDLSEEEERNVQDRIKFQRGLGILMQLRDIQDFIKSVDENHKVYKKDESWEVGEIAELKPMYRSGPFILDFKNIENKPVTVYTQDLKIRCVDDEGEHDIHVLMEREKMIGAFKYIFGGILPYQSVSINGVPDPVKFRTKDQKEMESYLLHRYYETQIHFREDERTWEDYWIPERK